MMKERRKVAVYGRRRGSGSKGSWNPWQGRRASSRKERMRQRRDIGQAIEEPPTAAGGTSWSETPRNLYFAPYCSRGIFVLWDAARRIQPQPPAHQRAVMHHSPPPLCILHAARKSKTSPAFRSLFVSERKAAEANSGFFPALVWSPHTTTQRSVFKKIGKGERKHRKFSLLAVLKGSREPEKTS